jgi:omega-6 fatty acid desaturase (delta-12 desaturase)
MTSARVHEAAAVEPAASILLAGQSSPIGLTSEAAGLPPTAVRGPMWWRPLLHEYARPDRRSAVQLGGVLAMFAGGWLGALWALDVNIALSFAFDLIIAVSVVRAFIIFHDCGHGSFSRSARLNDIVGSLLGIIVFTPFRYWNYAHAVHHATSSDLDRRGIGDVWTMTVGEYRIATRVTRRLYRAYHSPWVLFTVGALIKFLLIERIVTRPGTTPKRVKRSVHFTNIGIVVLGGTMISVLGPTRYLAVQMPALVFGGSGAIWLFYVQHRFEGAYWSRRSEWSFVDAGLRGSSYLRLGPVLQFVSGNIGFHHLHHLDARIPNYNLPRCAKAHPDLHPGTVLTLRSSLAALHLKLWDEEQGRYVGFRAAGL